METGFSGNPVLGRPPRGCSTQLIRNRKLESSHLQFTKSGEEDHSTKIGPNLDWWVFRQPASKEGRW
jgi:hypothetical protein